MRDDRNQIDVATGWALRIGVALVFTLTGLEKFSTAPTSYWVHTFDAIGLGAWFRYFTGAVEVLGGLLFLVPRATIAGAALLAATMLGAMVTHVVVFHRPGDALFPAAYLAGVALAFAKLRRDRRAV